MICDICNELVVGAANRINEFSSARPTITGHPSCLETLWRDYVNQAPWSEIVGDGMPTCEVLKEGCNG